MESSAAHALARDANDILAAGVKAHPDRFAASARSHFRSLTKPPPSWTAAFADSD